MSWFDNVHTYATCKNIRTTYEVIMSWNISKELVTSYETTYEVRLLSIIFKLKSYYFLYDSNV
jgi:hypothetical protein